MCMGCVANADLAVSGGLLGAAALRLRLLQRFRPRASAEPDEAPAVPAER